MKEETFREKVDEIVLKHSRNSGDYVPDYNFKKLREAICQLVLDMIGEKMGITCSRKKCREFHNECEVCNETQKRFDRLHDHITNKVKGGYENQETQEKA